MNALDVITRSMRRLGILASGDLPTQAEQDDALQTLKGVYRSLIRGGAMGEYVDIAIEGEHDAQPGQRVFGSLASVNLPETAPDCTIIAIVDPTVNLSDEYIFDAATQKWVSVDDLELTDDAPLSVRDPAGLACLLAIDLSDEYGQQVSEVTVRKAAEFRMGITQNWSSAARPRTASEMREARARYF